MTSAGGAGERWAKYRSVSSITVASDGLPGGHGRQEVLAAVRHGGRSGQTFFSLPHSLSFVSGDEG